MHEYSIVAALLQQVEAEAKAHDAVQVARVRVTIGELAGVETELLETAWRLFREGTCCAEADLDVRSAPARWHCASCDAPITAGERLRCPRCTRPARLAGGDELVLERIEMEVMHV